MVFILALTVNDIKESSGRQRHHSAVSTEDEDEISEKMTVIEARMAVEINDGSFSWDLTNKEPVIQNINIKIPTGIVVFKLIISNFFPHAGTFVVKIIC